MGHNALGAGQLIDQGASLVDIALREGSIFSGDGWNYIQPSFADNTLHFIGLLSDGGVHSRTNQLYACVRGAAERGAKKIRCARRPGLDTQQFYAALPQRLVVGVVQASLARETARRPQQAPADPPAACLPPPTLRV